MIKEVGKFLLVDAPILLKTWILWRLPVLYPLAQIKPGSATIMLTNRCNLKCIMCRQWQEPAGVELSTDEWKKIMRELKKNRIHSIHFTGGEVLLRKDLKDLILYGTSMGFTIGLTTNGILLNRDVLRGLVDSGLRSCVISVDAIGGAYDTIRGVPGSFTRVKEAVFTIANMRKERHIDASVNFTLMTNNMDELKNVKRLLDEADIPLYVALLDKHSSIFSREENRHKQWVDDFTRLDAILEFLRKEKTRAPGTLILNYQSIDFIGKYFKDPRQGNIPCVSSQGRIIIDPYGNLLGGCMAMGSFGNITQTPLDALQKEKRYASARKNMFYKRCPGCSCGYVFNIRHFPPLAIRELGDRVKERTRRKI